MERVKIIDHPLYQLLRSEKVEEFNKQKQSSPVPSFELCDFRGLDLRGLDASGLDLKGAYFRGADLRGIDFRKADLEGSSIASTKISGCYFPEELSPDEIVMSVTHGTRLRYRR
ncbi:hypothetical protein EUZ85_29630 [Hahella sp. KA22]|uniref:pentapeptide repeat-containing protein n=1 Tax=Hahella sp. KA22 TaxID=1628392 RepID=UPI000FDD3539|nr:pentapeptide repeat-containing protein [Hahella sp. KA22]AZZ94648.1 hypothetical protein ENC22_27045 [Hahella sp. KA22]QAY58021.1 hypothetical protein EUZ85_29630 [Hahella sp. KA22]